MKTEAVSKVLFNHKAQKACTPPGHFVAIPLKGIAVNLSFGG
jgi:hypothetical protein